MQWQEQRHAEGAATTCAVFAGMCCCIASCHLAGACLQPGCDAAFAAGGPNNSSHNKTRMQCVVQSCARRPAHLCNRINMRASAKIRGRCDQHRAHMLLPCRELSQCQPHLLRSQAMRNAKGAVLCWREQARQAACRHHVSLPLRASRVHVTQNDILSCFPPQTASALPKGAH